jgi:hypothetical protein
VKANTDSPSEMSPINYPVLQFAYDFQPTWVPKIPLSLFDIGGWSSY